MAKGYLLNLLKKKNFFVWGPLKRLQICRFSKIKVPIDFSPDFEKKRTPLTKQGPIELGGYYNPGGVLESRRRLFAWLLT